MDIRLSKQSQVNVKENNLRLVLETIIKNEPVSRADIMRITNISKPTVGKLIVELIEKDLIRETGIGKPSLGRPPVLLEFNSMKKCLLALDFGREECLIAVSDLLGNVLKEGMIDIDEKKNLMTNLAAIKKQVNIIYDSLEISPKDIIRAICACPGIYLGSEKGFIWYPGSMEHDNYDIHPILQEELGVEAILEHSTKLALLGETRAGKAKDYRDAIYIDFGYGLGSSLLINGEIYYGPHNASGEIGYTYTQPEEFEHITIQPFEHGPLCSKVSGKAIQEAGEAVMEQNGSSMISELANVENGRVTSRLVFDAAQKQDETSLRILNDAFGYFNMALCNIINVISPEIIIFGGGFTYAGDFLLHLVRDALKGKVLFMPKMEISTLKKEASIIGGIYYLIQSIDFLNELI